MTNTNSENPNSHLVTVYTVSDQIQAELMKNMLFDHGIHAELGGEHQGGFTGVVNVEIIVRESDAKAATEFLKIHFPNA